MGCVELEGRIAIVIEFGLTEGGVASVATLAVRPGPGLVELSEVGIRVAVLAGAALGPPQAVSIGVGFLGGRNVTSNAREGSMQALQLEAGPGTVVEAGTGTHREALDVVATLATPPAIDFIGEAGSVEAAPVGVQVATRAAMGTRSEGLLDEPQASPGRPGLGGDRVPDPVAGFA